LHSYWKDERFAPAVDRYVKVVTCKKVCSYKYGTRNWLSRLVLFRCFESRTNYTTVHVPIYCQFG